MSANRTKLSRSPRLAAALPDSDYRLPHQVVESRQRVTTRMLALLQAIDGVGDLTSRYLLDGRESGVRTTLALLASQFGAGCNEQVITAAEAIEMTHLASVYHVDDVRDSPTGSAAGRTGAPRGNSLAILSGDLLLARAHRLIASLGADGIRIQTEAMQKYCVGALHDAAGAGPGEDPVAHHIHVVTDTAGCFMGAAAELGLTFSLAPKRFYRPVIAFAEKFAIAHQLTEEALHPVSSRTQPMGTPRSGFGSIGVEPRRACSRSEPTLQDAHRWVVAAMAAIEDVPDCRAARTLHEYANTVISRGPLSMAARLAG